MMLRKLVQAIAFFVLVLSVFVIFIGKSTIVSPLLLVLLIIFSLYILKTPRIRQ